MSYSINKQPDEEKSYQKDFAEFFGPLMPHLGLIKNIGHFLSGFSILVAIYFIVQSELNGLGKYTLILISLITGLLAAAINEVGISKVGPLFIRQIVFWKFPNKWFRIMFGFLALFVLPLIFMSPIISGIGGDQAIEKGYTDFEKKGSDLIESNFQRKLDSLTNAQNEQKQIASNEAQQKEVSIKAKYSAKQIEWEQYKTKYEGLKNRGFDWAIGHIEKANNKMAKLRIKETEELDDWNDQKLNKLHAYDLEFAKAKKELLEERKKAIAVLEAQNTEGEKAHKKTKGLLRYFTITLAVLASIAVVLIIIIREVYRKGSGHEYQKREYDDSMTFFGILYEKYLAFRQRQLIRLARSKPVQARSKPRSNPRIGFVPNNERQAERENEREGEELQNIEIQDVQNNERENERNRENEREAERETDVHIHVDSRIHEDIPKIVQRCRNYYRRGKEDEYKALVRELNDLNFSVVETGPNTLSINPKVEN